jgi:putative ATP-dependent endonuclease of OLD family
VYQPAHGLTTKQQDAVQRYLDAVRCSLLFAKSVVLVEGDAEEILIPILVKVVFGLSLDELGVSLINIRSTGFENVANLFHVNRIRKRCSIITDRDATFFDVTPNPADNPELAKTKRDAIASAEDGNRRFDRLTGFAAGNPYVELFFAPHTFEVDFVAAGNRQPIVRALPEIFHQQAAIDRWTGLLEDPHLSTSGWAALELAKKAKKGWFAILLGRYIGHEVVITEYIADAILFAHGTPSRNVLAKILRYRAVCSLDPDIEAAELASLTSSISQFEEGVIDLAGLRLEVLGKLPNDAILPILAKV